METKNLDDLKANPKNPRRINEHDFNALKKAIDEFGDLSGIVFNIRTQQLVGGHQRTEAFKRLGGQKRVVIRDRYQNTDGTPQPNAVGTIAIGFVDYKNEQFSYREVDWDAARESAANIAANRIQGEFDLDLLSEVTYEIMNSENGADLMKLTGQSDDEIKRLMKMNGTLEEEEQPVVEDEKESGKLEFALTKEQREIVEEALGHIKATRELQAEQNSSMNGAALFTMSRDYLDKLHGLKDDAPTQPEA